MLTNETWFPPDSGLQIVPRGLVLPGKLSDPTVSPRSLRGLGCGRWSPDSIASLLPPPRDLPSPGLSLHICLTDRAQDP